MDTVSVTDKGQVVIPVSLRNKFNIKKGSKVKVEEGKDGYILLKPLPDDPVEASRGILKSKKSLLKSLKDDRKKEANLG